MASYHRRVPSAAVRVNSRVNASPRPARARGRRVGRSAAVPARPAARGEPRRHRPGAHTPGSRARSRRVGPTTSTASAMSARTTAVAPARPPASWPAPALLAADLQLAFLHLRDGGLQLLVERLHLLVGGLQFLVEGDDLFHVGLCLRRIDLRRLASRRSPAVAPVRRSLATRSSRLPRPWTAPAVRRSISSWWRAVAVPSPAWWRAAARSCLRDVAHQDHDRLYRAARVGPARLAGNPE